MDQGIMKEDMIRVENISMHFRLMNDRISSIKEMMTALARRKVKFKEYRDPKRSRSGYGRSSGRSL